MKFDEIQKKVEDADLGRKVADMLKQYTKLAPASKSTLSLGYQSADSDDYIELPMPEGMRDRLDTFLQNEAKLADQEAVKLIAELEALAPAAPAEKSEPKPKKPEKE